MKSHVLAVAAAVVAVSSAIVIGRSAQAQGAGGPYLGEIMEVPYTFCPMGWTEARGQILPINQNTALFSLLGNRYGGDGKTTFALPNLPPAHAAPPPAPSARALPTLPAGPVHLSAGAPLLHCIALAGIYPATN